MNDNSYSGDGYQSPRMGRLLIRVVPILIAVIVVVFRQCSAERFVNDLGRTAKMGMSPSQEAALGVQAYRDVLSKSSVIRSGDDYEMVRRCATRLAAATGKAGSDFKWEVSVVQSPQVNAFCLPGGKIVVYTGILPVARTEAGLAVVLGHEMGHATLRHGSERILQQEAANTILTGVNYSMSDMDYGKRQVVMGALGAGAQYGVLNPFGREHESEADAIGLVYMARAGYDPSEAIAFWKRMASMGGQSPPEFLSTHPSHATRVHDLEERLPQAMQIYKEATAALPAGR
jgi:metalloendopeptidase OMA1, mitochondrial